MNAVHARCYELFYCEGGEEAALISTARGERRAGLFRKRRRSWSYLSYLSYLAK